MSTYKKLGYFGADYDSPKAYDVKTRYVILSSPRTGSNYLCARLGNFRDVLGLPMEYIHRDAFGEIGGRELAKALAVDVPSVADIDRYMEALERRRTTADGYFGLKIQPTQLWLMAGEDLERAVAFLRRFDKVIVMLRKDKLAQAISGAIAQSTGRWINFGEEVVVDKEQLAILFPWIANHLRICVRDETLVNRMLAKYGAETPLVVYYENVSADPEAVTRQVVSFLDPARKALPPEDKKISVTERPSGQAAAQLRADFLAYITNSSPV